MACRVPEIDTAPTIVVIDAHVFRIEGPTAILDILCFQPGEDFVELPLRYLECLMVRIEFFPAIEIQRKCIVHFYHDEAGKRADISETEYSRIELRGFLLVARRYDGVIERNCHEFLREWLAEVVCSDSAALPDSNADCC